MSWFLAASSWCLAVWFCLSSPPSRIIWTSLITAYSYWWEQNTLLTTGHVTHYHTKKQHSLIRKSLKCLTNIIFYLMFQDLLWLLWTNLLSCYMIHILFSFVKLNSQHCFIGKYDQYDQPKVRMGCQSHLSWVAGWADMSCCALVEGGFTPTDVETIHSVSDGTLGN